ncbi:hypothetical protein R2R70_18825, partial [Cobetia sp. SIMBA_158]|uniref:hypothetical protein n=1 Tax=Cobetia sp. SIMBA_158 TaxID=3081617 RepID=UPI00397FE460
MAELTDLKIVKIFAGNSKDGKSVFEEIPMFSLGSRNFKLAASPSLALGVAKGDTVEIDESTGDYSVVVGFRLIDYSLGKQLRSFDLPFLYCC